MKYEIPQCLGMRVRRLSRAIDNEYRKCVAEFGLTENQLSILFLLSKKERLNQGEIGKTLGLERSTVSRNIKLMIQNGWVSKTHDYQPRIDITQEGITLVSNVLPKWEQLMDGLVKKLGDSSFRELSNWEEKLL